MDVSRIDPTALRDAARRQHALSDSLTGDVLPLLHGSFGASAAGREHADRGQGLRLALECSADAIRMWSHAMAETAAALQITADRYVSADGIAADRLGHV